MPSVGQRLPGAHCYGFFTGNVAWRFTIPTDALPPGFVQPEITNWLGPGGHIVHYYVRRGALVNVVAIRETGQWTEESWTARGTREELHAAYAGWNDAVHRLFEHARECYKWGLFDRDPLARWTQGRVTLLGDAAHPMLPFLGQGAAMGIEDAMLLARAFDAAGSVDEALHRYVEARQSRTTWVMQQSRETARTYHSGRSENFQPGRHVSAESLGIMTYNPAAVPV